MRVLFVDDEDDIRDLIEIAIMTEEDIDATFAGSGTEAIAILEREVFDVVMLDVMMPPPDGLAVLRKARSVAGLKDSVFVMCTAKTSIEAEQEFLALGADHVLHKPFKPLKLAAHLRSLV
tara:strand:+ start:205 stop:564 length:360 start_codon:yes stop_codon:yes gene_type:complete